MGDFYKLEPNGEILVAGGSIYAPSGVYLAADHEQYIYPTPEGWYWFDDIAMATLTLSPSVPSTVSPAQACVTLAGMPSPLDPSQTFLAAIEGWVATQGLVVQIAWNRAQTFERKSNLVNTVLKTVFGQTDEQIDEIFRQAALISF